MCVQLRSLSHAQVLKDNLSETCRDLLSLDPFITKHPPSIILWGEGAWRLGHISSLRTLLRQLLSLDFTPLLAYFNWDLQTLLNRAILVIS